MSNIRRPRPLFGRLRLEAHPLPRRGMGKAQLTGKQRKRALVAWLAVFALADQRQSARGKLHAYLVRPPGVQCYVNLT